MEDPKDVLIIKTGYSEFLDNGDSNEVSLGDVFRVTPLLHVFNRRGDRVTWLTDSYALPILEGNPYIAELLHLDFKTAMRLSRRTFDIIVNLEKNREICELEKIIDAWRRCGFRIDSRSGDIRSYDRAHEVLTVSSRPDLKKKNRKTTQELLFQLVGEEWNGEEYILGYVPQKEEIYDVAFNITVGRKWPDKAWDKQSWDGLEGKLVNEGVRVTRQDKQGEDIYKDIRKYIDWINSARVVVTSDSFGMHLAIALKKKVVALFGPTPSSEVCFYGRGEAVLPDPIPECLPCFSNKCTHGPTSCINLINVDRVLEKVIFYLKN